MTLRNKRVHPTYKYPICIREISEYFISSRPSYLYERYGQTTQFRSAKRDTYIWYQDFVLSSWTSLVSSARDPILERFDGNLPKCAL